MKKKIIAWFMLFAMMIALVPAGSVQAAEKNLYLSDAKIYLRNRSDGGEHFMV